MITATKTNKHPNTSVMRIQYFLSVFLSVFVMVSACQRGVDRMYMDSNGSHASGHEKGENHASLIPSQALISGLLKTDTQNSNEPTSLVPSSNGPLTPTELSIHALQKQSTGSEVKPAGGVVQGQDEKKEEASQASPELTAWFQRFVDVLDHAEEWDEVAGLLAEGRRCGYLDKGVSWDDDQYTPLHYVAEEGDLEVVQELIEKYGIPVDIRTKEYQRTPLHLAASNGQLAVVKYLLSQKAFLYATDKDGSSPLHYAVLGVKGKANTEVAACLHDKGADLRIVLKGFNLLHLAIKVGNLSLVEYLLKQCPTLVNQEICGITPLAYAQAKRETSIAEAIEATIDNQAKPCWQLLPNCRIH